MKPVTNCDALDKQIYDETASTNKDVRQLQASNAAESFQDLLTDGFAAFYKSSPRVLDEVPPERHLNATIMRQLMELREYKDLRAFTLGDEYNSVSSLEVVKSVLSKIPPEAKEKQQEMEELDKALEDELEATEPDMEEIKNILQDLQDIKEEMQESLEEASDEIRQATRAALEEAMDGATEMEAAMESFGYDSSTGEHGTTSLKDKMKVAGLLHRNRKLREIVELAGRFIHIAAKKQKQKVHYARHEVEGLELGSSLPEVIPSEYMLLAHPTLKKLFYAKFLEGSLVQYKLRGKDKVGKGPIMVAIDCSGSMAGRNDIWSKAVGLAMYSIARLQKRDFGMLLFDDYVKEEVYFKAGENNVEQLYRLLAFEPNWGTSFEAPLGRMAVNDDAWITRSQFNKADIVFITDGYCSLTPEFMQKYQDKKKERQFACFAIFVNGRRDPNAKAFLEKFSDQVVDLFGDVTKNQTEAFDLAFSI